MRPVLLDSSVYIGALREGDEFLHALKGQFSRARLWLSAVVLEELYAGASRGDRRIIERLEREFDRVGRILVPSLSDWVRVGKLLAQVAAHYGYEPIGQARLTNDALIAISAARHGVTVVTSNQRDFARLARFTPFQYEVNSL